MAFMNQERKKTLEPGIKAVLKKYNISGRLSVRNHMVLVLNITRGKIDFINDYIATSSKNYPDDIRHLGNITSLSPNIYWLEHRHSGVAYDCLRDLNTAMNVGNWDRSDVMTDYFDVGWYNEINIGKWNKPYVLES